MHSHTRRVDINSPNNGSFIHEFDSLAVFLNGHTNTVKPMSFHLYCPNVPSTWSDLLATTDIDAFEDPVYNSTIPWSTYLDTYGQVLRSLDGSDMTSHVNFFFRRCPLNKGILRFTDEDTKRDFYDEAKLAGIIPPLHEIHEGESEKEKLKRSSEEVIKPPNKAPIDLEKKRAKMQAQIEKTLQTLTRRLAQTQNSQEVHKLQQKIAKTKALQK